MENNVEFLDKLKAEVLHLFGEELKSSASFERFSAAIEQETGSSLSVFTLKRLFGQMKTDGSPSINTLSILARYAGYAGWGDFVAQHCPAIKDETIAPPKKRRPNYLVGAISALFVLLAAGLLFLPMGHSPKNPNEVTGTIVAEDNTLTWTLDKSTWALSITGQGKMRNFQQHGMPEAWLAYRDSLRRVVIGEGVTHIGDCAFRNCTMLASIILPQSCTSIGDYAFDRCSSLTDIDLPAGLTSIGRTAFWGCQQLKKIVLPVGITKIEGELFCYCSSLQSCSILGSITSLNEYAFAECEALEQIQLPEGLQLIGLSAFSNCYSLTRMDVPEGVTDIHDYAFHNCKSLTEVTLPSTLSFIGNQAFELCSHLRHIDCVAPKAPHLGYDVFIGIPPSTIHLTYPQGANYSDWLSVLP